MNIVSFYAPRPEHPFFQDYRFYLDLLRESCARYGHRHIVLTDDAAAVGGDGDAYQMDLPRSLMRAYVTALRVYCSDPQFANVPTLLTGADCVLANNPAGVLAGPQFDMAITTGDFADCRMNCGAIWVPNPARVAAIFSEALGTVTDEWGSDQTAIYAAVQRQSAFLTVKELPVDPYNLAPEHPSDDCTRGVVLHFRGPRKRWMTDYCYHWLGIGEGTQLKMGAALPGEQMVDNVRVNVLRGLPEIAHVEAHSGHAVLIGGGPSLADTFPEIRRRAADGQTMFALNGAAGWLTQRGFIADYGVIMDAHPSNVSFLDGHVDRWLLASQCDPGLVEEAVTRGLHPRMWHFMESARDAGVATMAIGGGVSVGLTAMGLAYEMGYRKMHLYGYDSSHRGTEGHAFQQTMHGWNTSTIEVWSNGIAYQGTPGMIAQAKAFPEWAATLVNEGCIITVHGDGLLPSIAQQMHSAEAVEAAMLA